MLSSTCFSKRRSRKHLSRSSPRDWICSSRFARLPVEHRKTQVIDAKRSRQFLQFRLNPVSPLVVRFTTHGIFALKPSPTHCPLSAAIIANFIRIKNILLILPSHTAPSTKFLSDYGLTTPLILHYKSVSIALSIRMDGP